MPKHVLILGCGRSGTSIFGELFETLPEYKYLSEPAFDELLREDFGFPIAAKVPRESVDFPAPAGLSFPLAVLFDLLDHTPVIFWIVRHPLDAISSLRVGISKNWGHHPKPPDWENWLARPLVEQCTHHWSTINGAGFNRVEGHAVVMKFEDLIANPASFAELVCDNVGLQFNGADRKLSEWMERIQNTNNERFVEAKSSRNYSRPDHNARVGRWRENLSDQDVRAIWPIVSDTAEQFGYKLDAR